MSAKIPKARLNAFVKECHRNNKVDGALFKKLDVKRGLRNADGSGVLSGLTTVSSVVGSKKIGDVNTPIHGELSYRGINIKDLVKGISSEKRFGFEEVTYLLLFGQLPTKTELDDFSSYLTEARKLPQDYVRDFVLNSHSPNIMNNLARGVLALYSFDKNPDDIGVDNLITQAISIIAKFPVIVAYSYHSMRYQDHGKTFLVRPPQEGLSSSENFLAMMRPDGSYTDLEAKVLDILLILHADHGGGNNSTFTTRVTTSSATDSYAAISAAVGSLKGPLHGGANISVMTMMNDIQANLKDWTDKAALKKYLIKILEKKAGDGSGKIFGVGHAVYTKSDPRAVVLKTYAAKLAKQKKRQKELDLYYLVEEAAPEVFAEYKGISKVISPNVDFYSGFVYDCLGIPYEVYTPLFAISRVAGWMSHRIEEVMVSKRIIRPGYKSVAKPIKFTKMANRK